MKKSFILHIDSLEILNDMTNEQKGILFDAIYKYQIGENVELDFAMKMAFAPFKNQFIRDDEAYLEISEAKSFKGKIGNLKRWHPDLYAQLNEDKTNIDELMEVARSRSSDASNPKQSSTIPQSLDSKKDSKSKKENKNDSESIYPFEEFWDKYDYKKDRETCEKKYSKISEEDRAIIKTHVKKYVESTPDKQFRKHPSTYLNGKCWNDEIITTQPTQKETPTIGQYKIIKTNF